jgi:hypothetical protein
LKVIIGIIKRVAIAVVNMFAVQQFSANTLFNDIPMLVNPLAMVAYLNLPVVKTVPSGVHPSRPDWFSARMLQPVVRLSFSGVSTCFGGGAVRPAPTISRESPIGFEVKTTRIATAAGTEPEFPWFVGGHSSYIMCQRGVNIQCRV